MKLRQPDLLEDIARIREQTEQLPEADSEKFGGPRVRERTCRRERFIGSIGIELVGSAVLDASASRIDQGGNDE